MASNKAVNKGVKQLIDKAEKWASSAEGKSKIKEAFKQATQATKKYEEAQFVNPKRLNEPFTI